MAYGLSNSHVTDDVTRPRRCCEAVRSAILATAWLLVFIFFILFSARKHYSALYAIARPSVLPSVCHMGGSVKNG